MQPRELWHKLIHVLVVLEAEHKCSPLGRGHRCRLEAKAPELIIAILLLIMVNNIFIIIIIIIIL